MIAFCEQLTVVLADKDDQLFAIILSYPDNCTHLYSVLFISCLVFFSVLMGFSFKLNN